MKEDRMEELKNLVPDTTYAFLQSEEGKIIQKKLKEEEM